MENCIIILFSGKKNIKNIISRGKRRESRQKIGNKSTIKLCQKVNKSIILINLEMSVILVTFKMQGVVIYFLILKII